MSDAVVNGLAGAGGGIVAQLLTFPLQAVNTRQQIQRKAKTGTKIQGGLVLPPQEKSLVAATVFQNEFFKAVKEEGLLGLYTGIGPALVGTICSQGVYYYFYQLFKDEAESRLLKKKQKTGSGSRSVGIFGSLLIGALAGWMNVLLTNPIWVVVTRMQTQAKAETKPAASVTSTQGSEISPLIEPSGVAPAPKVKGAFDIIRELYGEGGVLAFWKGFLPSSMMVSNPAIQFMLYENMLKRLKKRRLRKSGVTSMTAIEVFLLGAIAKLGATIVTYPVLVVKSRLHVKRTEGEEKAQQYTGTFDIIAKMIRYEGLLAFYKGIGTKIFQSVLAAAVLFMIKEELVKGARALVAKKKVLSVV